MEDGALLQPAKFYCLRFCFENPGPKSILQSCSEFLGSNVQTLLIILGCNLRRSPEVLFNVLRILVTQPFRNFLFTRVKVYHQGIRDCTLFIGGTGLEI